jgi:hypothetical protein
MSTNDKNCKADTASRRNFLKSVGTATALSVIGNIVIEASAAEMENLDEKDPTAKALKYAHDADGLDASIRPQTDHYCNNCQLYAGQESDEWAGCSIFPGKAVAGRGWCSVWAAKQPS